ncbi:MAG TPA: hypothetical protein VFY87_07145 [Geminicoccaceae bacterium]|nr:hypothetical protein [Geminicoccaceae bacterium]
MEPSPIWIGFATSFPARAATSVGALPAFLVRDLSRRAQDTFLGFAAGAMLFVISHRIIPETRREAHGKLATWASWTASS